MKSLLGNGAYSFLDAARFTGLRPARVREWFHSARNEPVFQSDYVDQTEIALISFEDLVEVYIAGQMRDRGVPLQQIRKIHSKLSNQWCTPHPFCRRELRTHGKSVFFVDADTQVVKDVLTGQKVFTTVISPFLKQLVYDSSTLSALYWKVANRVEINPKYSFGQPVSTKGKIPTKILATAYKANGRMYDIVAECFGVTKEDVKAAVAYERSLVA